ncbi:MAG: hypothetical protein R6X17_02915 [Candidatus Competibacteraceae bacterium]
MLEEATETTSRVETPLKQVVDEILDLIYRLSAMDETGFEAVAETLDDRLLASLKEFFKLLDDGGATLKLVEGQKEYVLQREDVERARTQADSMEIGEREQEETGVVYLLDSQRFELHPTDAGLVRRGTITADCLKELRGEAAAIPAEVIGRPWRVRLKVREVRQRSGAAKVSHTLTQLIERV